ncbi:MAG: hypothetical protein K6E51_04080 [Treponema sp.]|nr:hypothetical protein [Treponema sp.]
MNRKVFAIVVLFFIAGISLAFAEDYLSVRGAEIPKQFETKIGAFILKDSDECSCTWQLESDKNDRLLFICFTEDDDKEEIEGLVRLTEFILSRLPEQETAACKFASEVFDNTELFDDTYLCAIAIYSEKKMKRNGMATYHCLYTLVPKAGLYSDGEQRWPKYEWDFIDIIGDTDGSFASAHYIGWQR